MYKKNLFTPILFWLQKLRYNKRIKILTEVRYHNYRGKKFAHLKEVHKEIRAELGDAVYFRFLLQLEKDWYLDHEKNRPVYNPDIASQPGFQYDSFSYDLPRIYPCPPPTDKPQPSVSRFHSPYQPFQPPVVLTVCNNPILTHHYGIPAITDQMIKSLRRPEWMPLVVPQHIDFITMDLEQEWMDWLERLGMDTLNPFGTPHL